MTEDQGEEEEEERMEAAVELVAEMQLTAEQLKVSRPLKSAKRDQESPEQSHVL